jgi:hypothetical protein
MERLYPHGQSSNSDEDDGKSLAHTRASVTITCNNERNTYEPIQNRRTIRRMGTIMWIGPPKARSVNRQSGHITDCAYSLPLLYSLAKSWAWEAVAFRCISHPHEASEKFVDAQGDNVLHWVMFGRPPVSVVQTILDTCSALAAQRNFRGFLPLHGMFVFV